VSTNENKYHEVQSILLSHGISIDFAQLEIVEVQSDSPAEIAKEKVKSAFNKVGKQVIVEDDGLFIEDLNGFPGQYSSYVFKTVGNKGILRLLEGSTNRSAFFHSIIGFFDGQNLSISEGTVEGKISGVVTEGGWGYDPIFIPSGSNLTFGQLSEAKKEFSHRRKSLEDFVRWYLNL
jgi:XTP/dITP diphosphohydrolase